MTLTNYDFNGFTINLYVDEQGDWLAHFQEIPNISAFGDTPPEALEQLKLAWELVKEDYQEKGKDLPISDRPSAHKTAIAIKSISDRTKT